MWVEPNGQVRILTGVPFNIDYENTLYFASRSAQYTYFASKTKVYAGAPMIFPKVTYQRLERNYMKLEVNAEALYNCNYLMYQNTAFGDRWFYAFITAVDYVANQVTRIEYVIDVLQTWLLDCTLLPSYVERQHSISDALGSSFTDEPFNDLETIVRNKYMFEESNLQQPKYIFALYLAKLPATDLSHLDENRVVFDYQSGVGSGVYVIGYPPTQQGITDLTKVLNDYNKGAYNLTPNDVIAILQVRSSVFGEIALEPTDTFFGTYYNLMDNEAYPNKLGYITVNMSTDFKYYRDNGATPYVPMNKKLLQYPFSYAEVNDCRTQTQVFNPLYAKTGANSSGHFFYFTFYEFGCGGLDPSTMVVPYGYKTNLSDPQNPTDYLNPSMVQDYTMMYKGYINCSWLSDTFQAWLAQNGGIIPATYNMLKPPVMESIGGATVGGASGALLGGVDGVINSVQKLANAIHQPNQVHGNYNADIQYAAGMRDFMFFEKQIPAELAERIDMFFQMYGYAEKNVTVPNISSRPKWNYVQTKGLNFNADIPEDDAQRIITIFNNGIRFWKNANEVGQYSLDNSPSA